MKKQKKLLVLTLLMAIILVVSGINSVYAAESFNVNVSAEKQNYAYEQTVELTVKLSDIVSDSGLYGLAGKISYSTDVFEAIVSDSDGNTESITGLNGWSVSFNAQDNIFSAMTTSPAKAEKDIFKITLKVKNGATLGKTTIMLSDLAGATLNSDEDIPTTPASVSVNIKEATEEIPPITPSPEPSPEPSSTPSTEPSKTPSSKPTIKATATPSGNKLPQTGLKDYAVPVLIGALVISLIAYIAYRRYKNI